MRTQNSTREIDVHAHRLGEVRVDGLDVRYRVAGPTNERAPLLLLHGIGGDFESHLEYLFSMMAFRQRVIAVEFADPASERLELEHLVAQVEAVIDTECRGETVSLLGYCLGAAVAAKTASAREDIRNLVLVAGWQKTDTKQKALANIWRALRAQGSDLESDLMSYARLSAGFLKSRTPADARALFRVGGGQAFLERQMELYGRIDISEVCEAVTVRALVVGCLYDELAPLYQSKALFGSLRDCRYAEIPSGHAVMQERAAELFQYVDRFTQAPAAHPAGSILPALKP